MKKTAYITGASRGIGKAIAEALAKEGYDLALICHHNMDLLTSLANELQTTYDCQILTYEGDVSNYNFVTDTASNILNIFGHIDVVINNAGIARIGLLQDLSLEQWHEIIDTNLSACFYSAKAFLPSMIARQSGSIVNISSMWGSVGASCEVAYSASKGGMNAFTKALAKELAPSHIAVNAIACGVIDTQMNAQLSVSERAELAEQIPAGRFATTKEVAESVLSLLSAPDYLTGQIIGLDGGYI